MVLLTVGFETYVFMLGVFYTVGVFISLLGVFRCNGFCTVTQNCLLKNPIC